MRLRARSSKCDTGQGVPVETVDREILTRRWDEYVQQYTLELRKCCLKLHGTEYTRLIGIMVSIPTEPIRRSVYFQFLNHALVRSGAVFQTTTNVLQCFNFIRVDRFCGRMRNKPAVLTMTMHFFVLFFEISISPDSAQSIGAIGWQDSAGSTAILLPFI